MTLSTMQEQFLRELYDLLDDYRALANLEASPIQFNFTSNDAYRILLTLHPPRQETIDRDHPQDCELLLKQA